MPVCQTVSELERTRAQARLLDSQLQEVERSRQVERNRVKEERELERFVCV